MKSLQRGLTLIEAVVTVAVIAVLAGVAAPNLTDFIDRQRLVTQTLAVAELAQTAKSEALKRSATGAPADKFVTLTVKPANPWFVGLVNGNAACATVAACLLNQGGTQVPYAVTASQCTGCTIVAPTVTTTATFDFRGVRTTTQVNEGAPVIPEVLTITVQSPKGKQLRVVLSRLGRISVCAPAGDITGYPSC